MRQNPDAVHAKPDDTSLGHSGPATIDEQFLRAVNEARLKDDTVEKNSQRLIGFITHVNDSVLPNDFKTLRELLRTIRNLETPVIKHENEIVLSLWKDGKRKSRFGLPSVEEGALLSDDERRIVHDTIRKIRAHGWKQYKQEVGATDSVTMPKSIDEAFLKYLNTVHVFGFDDIDEQLRRLEECGTLILNTGLPDDYALIMSINQSFKDASSRIVGKVTDRAAERDEPLPGGNAILRDALKKLIDKGWEIQQSKKQ